MKNNKKRIDTYETPYEIYLVVANKYVTLEDLQELYTYSDGAELDNDIRYVKNRKYEHQAVTFMARRKSDGRYVIIVKYWHVTNIKGSDKLLDLINLASHEACHVTMEMYIAIGATIDTDNQEIFSYQQAYFCSCILKTWMNK